MRKKIFGLLTLALLLATPLRIKATPVLATMPTAAQITAASGL